MFVPKIVFFDIDDTLYVKQQRCIPDSARLAIKRLREKGIIAAIASGRSPSVLPLAVRELADECGMELMVLINGQYIARKGVKIHGFPMRRETCAEVAAALAKLGVNYAFVSENDLAVAREEAALTAAARALGLPYVVDARHFLRHDVYQMLAFFPPEQDDAVRAVLPEGLKTVRWYEYGVDILDEHGSKARGIAAALDALGLTMADAMAFGDGANDVEMLQAVGFGVAMGNAAPALKRIADYTAPPIDEDGIYRALCDLGVIEPVPLLR
ncbi:Cof-type HAD-IIB family hydrolase [Conchiformibius kuhniae]|uniref:Cof-type HAD-IIB family hydrolase n=1 Tax=Conchiformibius kuhniae TaxID=211502 RepID=A0A8T9MT19_9NEIS|nr:Cof-type HAD-IIB family hydrolase [Conchiformibius kuhniae]UOP04411.1 Cof-type HAD-IIB family hydrolase [Conchiformibius kuhniae]